MPALGSRPGGLVRVNVRADMVGLRLIERSLDVHVGRPRASRGCRCQPPPIAAPVTRCAIEVGLAGRGELEVAARSSAHQLYVGGVIDILIAVFEDLLQADRL